MARSHRPPIHNPDRVVFPVSLFPRLYSITLFLSLNGFSFDCVLADSLVPKVSSPDIGYGIVLAGLIVALIISIPKNQNIDTNARLVGETIDNRVGDYWHLEPAAYRSTRILRQVFPLDWDPSVPDDAYGGSALAWNYYSRHKDPNSPINMVIQGINENPPLGMELLIADDEFAVFIQDRNILENQQSLKPPTPAGDTLFSIPRGFLFRTIEKNDGPRIFSLIDILEDLGFDVDPVFDRFRSRKMKNRFSRPVLLSVIAILIGLTVVVFWVYLIGDIAIFRNLLKINPIYYVLLLAITLYFLFMRFLRWQFLLRRVGIRVPTRRSLSIYLASQLGIATPAYLGEILIRSILMKRNFQIPNSVSFWVWFTDRLLDIFALSLILLFTFTHLWGFIVSVVLLILVVAILWVGGFVDDPVRGSRFGCDPAQADQSSCTGFVDLHCCVDSGSHVNLFRCLQFRYPNSCPATLWEYSAWRR